MNVQRVGLASLGGVRLDALHRAPDDSRGTVVLAHGITVDLNEGGMFVRLAEELAATGFDALRFSHRGHGESDGTQADATIAGEQSAPRMPEHHERARPVRGQVPASGRAQRAAAGDR